MSERNRQITLAKRPSGFPELSDFALVDAERPAPGDGEVLVRTHYLSVDPYMRGRMNERKSYAPSVKIGEVMVGGVVGDVVESRHPQYAVGDFVQGSLGWQEYAVADGSGLRKVDPELAPISTAVGILGMPGLTAYCGLMEIGKPVAGETVVVSGAAGAVGSAVGQIAKIHGCRAVGIAGSEEKVRYVTDELGFDAAFDYRETDDYLGTIGEFCPSGVDVYFDNVGGPITDAVMQNINVRARVCVCGQISQYNATEVSTGPRWLWKLIEKQARVEGFLVFQFQDLYQSALIQMGQWVREGRLKYRETITEGIENAPSAFLGMLKGQNIGKQLVRVYTDS